MKKIKPPNPLFPFITMKVSVSMDGLVSNISV